MKEFFEKILRKRILFLNIISFFILSFFFLFLYLVFEPNLFSDFLIIYLNQQDGSILVGSLNEVAKIGYFGFVVFFLNGLLLSSFFKKEESFQLIISLTTFSVALLLILLEINLYLIQ